MILEIDNNLVFLYTKNEMWIKYKQYQMPSAGEYFR